MGDGMGGVFLLVIFGGSFLVLDEKEKEVCS